MKHIALFFTLLFLTIGSKSQDFSRYRLSNKKIILKFKTEKSLSKDSLEKASKGGLLEESGLNSIYLLDFEKELGKTSVIKKISDLNNLENLDFAAPMLEDKEGRLVAGLTNIFIVGLKNVSDFDALRVFCISNQFEIVRRSNYDQKVYFVRIKKKSSLNVLEASKLAVDSKLFRYCEPDYLFYSPWGTDDPAFNSQWALPSMSVVNAWGLTTGCSSIRIAVLDNGVQLDHPDLATNLLPGFDATGGNNGGASTGSSALDAHGTKCAGIVGAIANNQIGIAGVAYNCRIVPVKVGSGSFLPASSTADGINWVRANNAADIITFSAGSLGVTSQIITDAIDAATSSGRNNLGIPFFSISQNNSTNQIAFPASLENVIAVGSIDSNNNRASTSNFGTGLDVVAPGVCIYTTDLVGSAGETSSDYHSCFSGTSAAAPNAAGVMALILSVNPNLTLAQARFILESTTDKLSNYTFSSGVSGQPNGTWNSEVGYGKINAIKAVRLAGNILASNNPICSTSNFSLQYPQQASWSSSNPSGLAINSATGVGIRQNNLNGSAIITATISRACGNISLSRTVAFGTEHNAVDINSVTVGCVNNRAVTSLIFSPMFTTATKIDYYSKDLTNASNPYILKNTNPVPNGGTGGDLSLGSKDRWYSIKMVVTTPCGTLEAYYEVYANCSGGGGVLRAFPNPSSNQLSVQFVPEYSEMAVASTSQLGLIEQTDFEASLFSPFGIPIKSGKSEKGNLKFDTAGLLEGLYVLRVNKNGEVITKQIWIKH